ncbi:hypothetical protein [Streptomyces catenulae]|uniref:Uncharacterized protein n=1 Tax=Streptomyces catenulae TaxID=66875 RepID=A0ABV2YY32_9ACTN|nr:hypothetical protein [Streptomyces catenulae]
MPAALLEDLDLDIRELLDEETDTAAKAETTTVILTVQPSTCNC